MIGGDILVRPAERDDHPAIARLLDETFGAQPFDVRESLWRWRSESNPAASSGMPTFVVAESAGVVVGAHGLVPLRLQVGGDEVIASCACDLVADAAARGAGLKLKFAVMDASLAPIHMSTSANEPANRMMTALGGTAIDAARTRYLKVLRLDGLVRARAPSSLAGPTSLIARMASPVLAAERHIRSAAPPTGTELRVVTEFDALGALDPIVRQRFRVSIVRDAAYLQWRYGSYPFPGIETIGLFRGARAIGFVVVHVAPDEDGMLHGAILDLIADPAETEALQALLSAGIQSAADRGAHYVAAQTTDPEAARAYGAYGFMTRTSEFSPCTFRVAGDVPAAVLASDENWYLSLGDGDTSFFYPDADG